jgi:NAD(P)H dehydrogenase (quinone)
MLITGIPFTEEALSTTTSGGSPYGASHVTWNRKADSLTDHERDLARVLGRRVALAAEKLSQ